MADDKAWMRRTADDSPAPPKLDTSTAYSARVNNYWQGGKDNFAADRAAAQTALAVFPGLPAGQAFRSRAVRYLAGEAGVRQFLDLGTGLPPGDSLHQLAGAVADGCRVVYVDNDPMVSAHARALLASPGGAGGYIEADVRDTAAILAGATHMLDFSQPVAVLFLSVLHLIPDADDPYAIVHQFTSAVAPGSYLVIVHPSSDIRPEASTGMAASLNRLVAQQRWYRSQAEVSRFFRRPGPGGAWRRAGTPVAAGQPG